MLKCYASSTSLTEQGGRAEPPFYFSWFMCAQICFNVLSFLCPARYGNNEDLFEPSTDWAKTKQIGKYENDLVGL